MSVLVDSTIWSLALRRQPGVLSGEESLFVQGWADLVREGRACLIGPIRQEVLSGIRRAHDFRRVHDYLMDFPNIPILGEDYVEAARFFNQLQGRGITGWNVDLLICAVANRLSLDVFTRDEDFTHFAKHITVRLYPVGN